MGCAAVACRDGDCTNEAHASIQAYNKLKPIVQKGAVEVHHIIEKRFAPALGAKQGEMLSVPLNAAQHQDFTNQWRTAIPYSNSSSQLNTTTAEAQDILNAAQRIYKDYPILLDAAQKTIIGQ